MILTVKGFSGVAPRYAPHALGDGQAQTARNTRLWKGALEPLPGGLSVAAIADRPGVKKSLYRMGQTQPSDTQYWHAWLTEVDACRSPIAGETSERTYYTDGIKPKFTDMTLATAGTPYPFVSYDLGVPYSEPAALAFASGTPDPAALAETRAYVYTNVRNYSGFAEESSPSNVVTVDATVGQQVTLSDFTPPPAGAHNITHRRIYRSVAGSQGSAFLYVGEQPIAATEFVDTVSADNLGEQLASLTWEPPPDNLQGLVALPGGLLAGFVGQDVYFCDPWHPHAWPGDFTQVVDFPIVGLGVFGQSLLVITKGTPYLITGSHPDSMNMVTLDLEQAGVAKRSICRFGNGVIYASPDGLVYVGTEGSNIITQTYATGAEWQTLLDPTTLHGYEHDSRYYGFHATGGFIFDPTDRSGALTLHDIQADAAFVDLQVDALFYLNGDTIYKLHHGANLPYTWRSKVFQLPQPGNFACAQVIAENYTDVTLKVYCDGVLKLTKVVTSASAFRLPSGFKSRTVEVELSGTSPVWVVNLAGTIAELANV